MSTASHTEKKSSGITLGTLTGPLLLGCWSLTLLDALGWLEATAVATLLAWSYVALELGNLTRKQRLPVLLLVGGGLLFTFASWYHSGELDWVALGSHHLMLVMLLTSVNFIRMATRLHSEGKTRGLRSFIATYTGMHFFSSVANFSSLILVGEQIRRPGAPGLSPLSYILLTRGFALAIFWSPFLSMIALVLALVPNAQISTILPWALAVVIFGTAFTLIEARLRHSEELEQYAGYPMCPSSLALPSVLIGSLLVAHHLFPELPMLVLVSILAVTIPLIWQAVRVAPSVLRQQLGRQVTESLPNARPEISLFLAAGFLAAAVKTSMTTGLISSPFETTNALIASIVMVLIFAMASAGIHQFALVAIFAGLLEQVTSTPSLMAIGYMTAVSLSMSSSLFSGVNVILQGQYQMRSRDMLMHNLPYSIAVLVFTSALLFVMEANQVR